MEKWKESLKTAGRERTLERAKSAVDQGTEYKLGTGGLNPSDPMTQKSDCSGFVAWAIGIPRELPPGSSRWLQTTTYWSGGGNVGSGLFDSTDEAHAEPGDLYVYPDVGRKQGHMGIISRVQDRQPSKVIHCSNGNYNAYDDAIKETDPDVFIGHPKSRIMKVDYAALRALFDIAEPDSEAVETPAMSVRLKHPLLANDPTLQLVASGSLVLEPTGYLVGGCGPIHDALLRLAESNPMYSVDLGENGRYRGYYGPKTKDAIMNFQKDNGLPETGETDYATVLALDEALRSLERLRAPARAPEYPHAEPAVLCKIIRDNREYYASINGSEQLYIGRKVSYEGNYGLANNYKDYGLAYRAEEFEAEYGHWAYFIYPSVLCESGGYFNRINSYDKARFTFGFYQFAAHTPGENFVKLFRALLALDNASRYFPDLSLVDGFIVRQTDDGAVRLEDNNSSKLLQEYLNPSPLEVEDTEAVNAAKLIHWSIHDPVHRKVQVKTAMAKIKKCMPNYHSKYNLHGMMDKTCAVIADIRHQGRAYSADIIDALRISDDEESNYRRLLELGSHAYERRIQKLEQTINELVMEGIFGVKRYDRTVNGFV